MQQIMAVPSVRRRLVESGLGAVLAAGYWAVVLAMFVVALIFVLIVMGPGIILVWLVACAVAWGIGIVLMLVAGGLAFVPRLTRPATGFLVVSAFANAALIVGVLAAWVVAAILTD
jgi:hypothetical protein